MKIQTPDLIGAVTMGRPLNANPHGFYTTILQLTNTENK